MTEYEMRYKLNNLLDQESLVRDKIRDLIRNYKTEYPEYIELYDGTNLSGKVDDMAIFAAWIEDTFENYSTIPTCEPHSTSNYKDSRTKRIRKALGYNY